MIGDEDECSNGPQERDYGDETNDLNTWEESADGYSQYDEDCDDESHNIYGDDGTLCEHYEDLD